MSCHFVFKVEFSVEDFDLWTLPEELEKPKNKSLPATFKFTLSPSICMEITETEFIDLINVGKKVVKYSVASFDKCELTKEIHASIAVSKTLDGTPISIGCYDLKEMNCLLKQVAENFMNSMNASSSDQCQQNASTCEVRRELAQFVSSKVFFFIFLFHVIKFSS